MPIFASLCVYLTLKQVCNRLFLCMHVYLFVFCNESIIITWINLFNYSTSTCTASTFSCMHQLIHANSDGMFDDTCTDPSQNK